MVLGQRAEADEGKKKRAPSLKEVDRLWLLKERMKLMLMCAIGGHVPNFLKVIIYFPNLYLAFLGHKALPKEAFKISLGIKKDAND